MGFLVDTNVISEARKGARADAGVVAFFEHAAGDEAALFLSVVTVGELSQGARRMRLRGDGPQADQLEAWLATVLVEFEEQVLDFDRDAAQVWGVLCAREPHHVLDKQIAATALVHDLTVVTRNTRDFAGTGALLLNPFSG